MKTSDILLETCVGNSTMYLDFNDLTSIQIGALRAIYDNRLDFDNASERMLDVVSELQNLSLVDDTFELTDLGNKAVQLALQLGGSERRQAAARAAAKVQLDDIYDDDYPTTDDRFGDDWSEYQTNKY